MFFCFAQQLSRKSRVIQSSMLALLNRVLKYILQIKTFKLKPLNKKNQTSNCTKELLEYTHSHVAPTSIRKYW